MGFPSVKIRPGSCSGTRILILRSAEATDCSADLEAVAELESRALVSCFVRGALLQTLNKAVQS